MVGRLVFFWEGPFSGAMLVSGRVVGFISRRSVVIRRYLYVWVSWFHVVKILFVLLPEISSEAVEMVLITHRPKKSSICFT